MNAKHGYDGIEGLGLYDTPHGMGDLLDDLTNVATGVGQGVIDVVIPGAGLVTAAQDIYGAATTPDPSQQPLVQVDPNQAAAAAAAAAAGAANQVQPSSGGGGGAPAQPQVVVVQPAAPAAPATSTGIPTVVIVVGAAAVGLLAYFMLKD